RGGVFFAPSLARRPTDACRERARAGAEARGANSLGGAVSSRGARAHARAGGLHGDARRRHVSALALRVGRRHMLMTWRHESLAPSVALPARARLLVRARYSRRRARSA